MHRMLKKRFVDLQVTLCGLIEGDYIEQEEVTIKGYIVPSLSQASNYGVNTSDATALVITDGEALSIIKYWDNPLSISYKVLINGKKYEAKEIIPYRNIKNTEYDTVVIKL